MKNHPLIDYTKLFKAVGDPSRQSILLLLRSKGALNVGQISAHLKLAQPTTSQHLRILKEAGAIRSDRQGQHVYYKVCSVEVCDALSNFIGLISEKSGLTKESKE